jgi:hypothetical protein
MTTLTKENHERAPEAKVGKIPPMSRVASLVLTGEGHAGKAYDLSGPRL